MVNMILAAKCFPGKLGTHSGRCHHLTPRPCAFQG